MAVGACFTLAITISPRIDYHFVIKVADFGLSESTDTSKQYYRQDKKGVVKFPIKWLAPESINEGVFSEKTDVVSYLFRSFGLQYMPGNMCHPRADPESEG